MFLIHILLLACLVSLLSLPVSAAPTVTSITPVSGGNRSSIAITDITGTGFSTGATVRITNEIFNLTHRGSIIHPAGGSLLRQPYHVQVSGNYAYIASLQSNALEVVNIANPAAPAHAALLANNTGGAVMNSVNSLFVSGNYAYLTVGAGFTLRGLEIVDITNPAAPVHKSFLLDGTGGAVMNYPTSVFVAGNYAYVTSRNSNALEIVDISNPSAPVHAGSIVDGSGGALLQGAQCVVVSGNYAYIASSTSNALEIVDVSNPASPVHAGSIANGQGGAVINTPKAVAVRGNYAYVGSGFVADNALEIVDISNPASPVHAAKILDGQDGAKINVPNGLFAAGNFVYIANANNILSVVDVSNPLIPRHEAFISNGVGGAALRYATSVSVVDHYAYVTARDSNALEIVDLGSTDWAPKAYNTTAINVSSATHIDGGAINLPPLSAGTYNVVVINPDGTQGVLQNGFTALDLPLPAITGLSPASGTPSGGIPVSITGTGFTGATAVNFGGTAATSFIVNSDTSITATSPAMAAGTVDITVTAPGGTSATTAADQFVYVIYNPPSGGSDDSGQRVSTAAITSPVAGPGQSMSFATTFTVDEYNPAVILSVTVVPNVKIDQTDLIVTHTHMTDASLAGNRKTAGIASITVVGVNPSSIDHGTITFAISKSWLEQYAVEPKDIVMMHNTNGVWSELPTTYDRESGGAYIFSATTPGFSYFAMTTRITGVTGTAVATPATPLATDTSINPASGSAGTPGPVTSSVGSDLAIGTTTPEPVVSPRQQGTEGFPASLILGGLAVIVIIAAIGLYMHRRIR